MIADRAHAPVPGPARHPASRLHQQDGPLRGPLPRPPAGPAPALSARPVVPHQYAIGRGEDLLGYIDLVTEQAYAYRKGGPSDRIPLPEEYREREQAARARDARDAGRLRRRPDGEAARGPAAARGADPAPTCARRLGADQVVPVLHGRGRAGHGRAPAARGAGARRRRTRTSHARSSSASTATGPPLVQVLKNYHLPHAGKLSLARVWRGTVKDGMTLGGMRVGGVYRMMGTQQQPAGEAGPGEIVALARLEARAPAPLLGRRGPARGVELPHAPPAKPDVRLRADRRQPQRRGQALGRLRQADRRGPGAPARARPGDAPDRCSGARARCTSGSRSTG